MLQNMHLQILQLLQQCASSKWFIITYIITVQLTTLFVLTHNLFKC